MFVCEIFDKEPERYGLRGDKYFWQELKYYYKDIKMPYYNLKNDIYRIFYEITNVRLEEADKVYVDRFAHGGMTSGYLDGHFWRNVAIPLLESRLRYSYEEDYIKKYIQNHKDTDWVYISSDKRMYFSNELTNELSQEHKLFGINATALAKIDGTDNVLYSLSNGKMALVHLTYCKELNKSYPKAEIFSNVEEVFNLY